MQLLRLEVKNWCQHKHRVCQFTRGLVAIIGKIGSGKSNLLGAICWLLTGENPNNGLKAENVSQLSNDDEPSYAALEFEHAGHLVVVTRHLLPEKEQATLVVDGVEAARGDKAVTAYIEKLLGIDSKFMSRFVIVAQNEIFSFIEDGATEVDKFFQKLFGTATAEKCQDLIGKQLNKLVVPEIVEPSAQLAGRLLAIDEEIQILDNEIAKLPALAAFMAAQAEHNKVIQDWGKRKSLAVELASAETKLADLATRLTQLDKACTQYDDDLAALKDVINGHQETHASAKVALNHLATYKQIAKTKAVSKARLAEIAELRSRTPAPADINDDDIQAEFVAGSALSIRLQQAQEFVTAFTAKGIAECPTCHTPATDIAPALADAEKSIPELKAQLAANKQSYADLVTQRDARVAWEKQDMQLAAEEKQLVAACQDFSNIDVPATDESELVKIVSNHESLQKAYSEIEPLAQGAREKRAKYVGEKGAAAALKTQLLSTISELSVTESAAAVAETMLTLLSQQFIKRQDLEKTRAQTNFEREKLADRIAAVAADEAQAEKLRGWSQVASTAKDALKVAPRFVAKRNLQRLEVAINELLQIFSVDFFVRAASDDSPTFVAEFFDGRKQPAKRLSYGQKTVLALAFRVAVNALFAEEIGLLALDEPTAYLDQQRIKALAPVLEKLRELSTARGLQCLLVTHETSLSHLFESAVELDT